jgi:hypothetical protein
MRRTIAAVMISLALAAAAARLDRAAAGPQQPPPPAREAPLHRGGYLNAYIALLRSDLKARKTGFIAEGLRLSDKEAAVFWPVYKEYEAELKRLDEARLRLVKDYAENYDKMTDARAKELVERRLALEGQRVGLERKYFRRLTKVLPGRTAARFFQLDYRFGLLMSLKGVSEIPLIE